MFPNNTAWDGLAAAIVEMGDIMQKVARAEMFAYFCIAWSAAMALYFAAVIIKRDALPKVMAKSATIRNFRTTAPAEKNVIKTVKTSNSQFKTINSPAQGQKDTNGTFRYSDPEIERILKEFRA